MTIAVMGRPGGQVMVMVMATLARSHEAAEETNVTEPSQSGGWPVATAQGRGTLHILSLSQL